MTKQAFLNYLRRSLEDKRELVGRMDAKNNFFGKAEYEGMVRQLEYIIEAAEELEEVV